jgi:hypothetical protein
MNEMLEKVINIVYKFMFYLLIFFSVAFIVDSIYYTTYSKQIIKISELEREVTKLKLELNRKDIQYKESKEFTKTYRNQLNLCRTKLPK